MSVHGPVHFEHDHHVQVLPHDSIDQPPPFVRSRRPLLRTLNDAPHAACVPHRDAHDCRFRARRVARLFVLTHRFIRAARHGTRARCAAACREVRPSAHAPHPFASPRAARRRFVPLDSELTTCTLSPAARFFADAHRRYTPVTALARAALRTVLSVVSPQLAPVGSIPPRSSPCAPLCQRLARPARVPPVSRAVLLSAVRRTTSRRARRARSRRPSRASACCSCAVHAPLRKRRPDNPSHCSGGEPQQYLGYSHRCWSGATYLRLTSPETYFPRMAAPSESATQPRRRRGVAPHRPAGPQQ